MTFGDDWGWGAAKDEARKVYDAFREAGGNFIDTANIYTNGTSESFLGEFMAGHRQSIVLATKYTNAFPGTVHRNHLLERHAGDGGVDSHAHEHSANVSNA
jgi:aryl-alcohol dehydrogenase-like predicted oxidoreductase